MTFNASVYKIEPRDFALAAREQGASPLLLLPSTLPTPYPPSLPSSYPPLVPVMKQLSQIKNKIFTNKGAFPKTQDQKNLERQKGELDSFMLSFSTHEAIVDSIQRTLFEIYKARNISGIHIRDLRVEDFFQLKDNWHGTFEERISV